MEINKILFLVGNYVGDKDLLNETNGSASSDGIRIVFSYIDLFNIVLKRIASEFVVLKTKEVVETNSQNIKFADLKNRYFKIIKLVKDGKSTCFDIVDDGLKVDNGVYEIWYQYLPKEIDYTDNNVFDFNGRVSERIYALGVASEYC